MSHARSLPHRLAALLLLALSGALLLLGPTAARAAEPAAPSLTDRQAATVLQLVDAICGDTWCEGDHRFDFRRFTCSAERQACQLRLRIAPYTDGPTPWSWRTARLPGFVRYAQVVRTSPTGQTSLVPAFYTALDAEIDRIESTVPSRGLPG